MLEPCSTNRAALMAPQSAAAPESVPTSELLAVLRDLHQTMQQTRDETFSRLPKVKEGEVTAGGLSGQIDMLELLAGKYATVSQVKNTGDNPLIARFEGIKGGFVELTLSPREDYQPTFMFRSIEFRGVTAGASSYRVVVQ